MSFQIDTALVNSFRNTFDIQYQQKNSRFQPNVRVETQKAEFDFYDRIGSVVAQKKQGRHADTPLISTPHDRRRVGLSDYNWADMVDKADKIRMLGDPTNSYAMNAAMALNRAKDDECIAAATGPAYAGKDGTTVINWSDYTSVQQVPVTYDGAGGGTNHNLTIPKLIKSKSIIGGQDAFEPGVDQLILAHSQPQLDSLLSTTQVTSADYNTVKALVKGEIDSFMGFTFVQCERLNKTGNIRSVLGYVKSTLLLAIGEDITLDIGPRRDKNLSVQVYVEGSFGSCRMWEAQMTEILCDESVLT